MNVLDENIIDSQRHLLRDRGIAFRQIGVEVGQSGMSDQQVLALLHGLNRPTFFTRDDDFCERGLCHLRYCLVYIDADDEEVAKYVVATLRHPDLKTWAQRQGMVLRVSSQGGRAWRVDHDPVLRTLESRIDDRPLDPVRALFDRRLRQADEHRLGQRPGETSTSTSIGNTSIRSSENVFSLASIFESAPFRCHFGTTSPPPQRAAKKTAWPREWSPSAAAHLRGCRVQTCRK